MSGQGRSFYPSLSSHHRTHETHRTVSHSQHSTAHRTASSTSSSQWRSETNSRGHLIIAKKSEPSKAAEKRVEKKIGTILADFNERARHSEITQTTANIMRAVHKYNRGEYNDTERPSVSKTTASASRMQVPGSSQTQHKSALKITPKKTSVVEPKKVANRLASINQTRANGQRIPRELMSLYNSDGFVEKPPTNRKRTPKKVMRFSESLYTKTTRSSTRRKSDGMAVQQKTIEKKVVQPTTSTWYSSGASQHHKTTVTQTKATVQQVERTVTSIVTSASPVPVPVSAVVLQPPAVVRTISQATTVSTQRNGGANFTHNRIKISHYPMIEVKLEQ
ncbi:uncharacterized protein LOC129576214 [Sitodiplosis mosellana]|uniref:uncharacterized protein LOC129576214 n=1 Tax=Sitodiplosis mosellana TaxID=263140 RepID=UPI002444795D|nr:uncharacterized protein LOC129576214 [Sitodiplosis mosellana]